MSSYAPESTQQAVSMLLYRDSLPVCARVISWETEWRLVNINLAEAVVLDCDRFIVASCVLPLILRCFLSTLVCVLASMKC